MPVTCEPTPLPGVRLFMPQAFGDARGFFMEFYHQRNYAAFGPMPPLVQDNFSRSSQGVLRGLHYQLPHAQAKLITVLRGAIFDVAVDIRRGSPTFGQWTGHELNEENHHQLYVPEGFAHGFCVLSEKVDVLYKCSDYYAPSAEHGLRWDDPDLAIAWPGGAPLLSARDQNHPRLKDIPPDDLPLYVP
jgi:dTDP-4-dehydrorhamnose 3,5-epimerase